MSTAKKSARMKRGEGTKLGPRYRPHDRCVVLEGPLVDDNRSQWDAFRSHSRGGKLAVFSDLDGAVTWQHVRDMLLADARFRGMTLSAQRASVMGKLVAEAQQSKKFDVKPEPVRTLEAGGKTVLETALDRMMDAEVIAALKDRPSTLGVLMRAAAIAVRKSQDYDQQELRQRGAAHSSGIERDAYFPFGHKSYIHMLHTKVQRLISLEAKRDAGQDANFEGTYDTVLDIINYASFFGERLERELRTETAKERLKGMVTP